MITTTLGELVSAKDGLVGVLKLALPAKVAYHAAKLAKKVQPEIQAFHDQRNAAIKRLGKPSENKEEAEAGMFKVPPDTIDQFNAEVKELSSVEVKIDMDPIKMSSLDGFNIEGAHLLSLGPLLNGEE